ncbi:transposase family protein [Streptomyces sp. NPDC055793]
MPGSIPSPGCSTIRPLNGVSSTRTCWPAARRSCPAIPARCRRISGLPARRTLTGPTGIVRQALVVAVVDPLPGSRNDCRALTESSVDIACRGVPVIADAGYQGTGLLIPHHRRRGQNALSPQQQAGKKVHRKACARVEHAPSRLKNWKILRDCRLKGSGVHPAMLSIARLHNLALTSS